MKWLLLAVTAIFICDFVFAQPNTFFKTYPSYLGHASCVIEADSGGFILLSPGVASTSDFTIKTDSMGNEIISKAYCNRYAYRMTRALDSNYVFAATTKPICTIPGNYRDIVIVKLNSSLDTLWTREYGTTSNEQGSCIRTLKDGNYIVSALADGGGVDNLFKLDTSGNIIWQHYVFPPALAAVIEDSDSNFVVCGGSTDWRISKTNSTGDSIIWNKVFYLNAIEAGLLDLIELADGNYFAGGFTDNPAFFKYVKIDRMTGDTIWSSPASANTLEIYSFNNGHNGNIIMANGDMTLINQAGNVLWSIGINNVDFRYAIATSDGGYAASGYFQQSMGIIHPVLLKADSLGNYSTTEIEEQAKSEEYSISPNPASEYSVISYPFAAGDKICVTDVSGRILFSKTFSTPTLNLSDRQAGFRLQTLNFPPGIYFVKVIADGKQQTKKLVKM